MCAPKFFLQLRKKCLLLKPKSYLGKVKGRAHHVTLLRSEPFVYHFLGFAQTFITAFFLETSFKNYTKEN